MRIIIESKRGKNGWRRFDIEASPNLNCQKCEIYHNPMSRNRLFLINFTISLFAGGALPKCYLLSIAKWRLKQRLGPLLIKILQKTMANLLDGFILHRSQTFVVRPSVHYRNHTALHVRRSPQ